MMFRIVLSVGCAVAALAGPARADTTWIIDPAHTSVGFGVRHMMISTVRGEFTEVSGTVVAHDEDLTRSTVQVTIKASSIDTREAKRDQHLRSADFLDVEHFPTITFVSRKIAPAGTGRWTMTGDLTLHGVTREAMFEVEAPGTRVKDPTGKTRAGAHATTRINRKDFGIVWNKALDGGGLAVGDDVDVTVDVEAVQQAAGAGG